MVYVVINEMVGPWSRPAVVLPLVCCVFILLSSVNRLSNGEMIRKESKFGSRDSRDSFHDSLRIIRTVDLIMVLMDEH